MYQPGLAPETPLRYTGAPVNIMTTTQSPRPPTVNDTRYPLNTVWRVSGSADGGVEGDEWILVDFVSGDAIWRLFSSGSGTGVLSLTGDSGGAVFADAAGNIDDFGGTAITTVGIPASNLITTNIDFTKQSAVAPVQPTDQFLYYRSSGTSYNLASESDILASPRATNLRVENLGMTYAAGVFTITAADGTALSATNPAYICLQSNVTDQKYITVALTTAYSFDDASSGTSDIIGNTWGTTSGVAWGNQRPFFLYAVCDASDANPQIFISDSPCKTIADGNLAKTGSAIATSQADCFFLNNPTVASYANNNVVYLGCTTMTKDASDDWTVNFALNPSYVGINRFPYGINWVMPQSQYGAETGKYQYGVGGGTAPSYGSTSCRYKLDRDGSCRVTYTFGICTAGSGTNVISTPLPYIMPFGVPGTGTFVYDPIATSMPVGFQAWAVTSGTADCYFVEYDSGTYTPLQCNTFANNDNNFQMYIIFNAFNMQAS